MSPGNRSVTRMLTRSLLGTDVKGTWVNSKKAQEPNVSRILSWARGLGSLYLHFHVILVFIPLYMNFTGYI